MVETLFSGRQRDRLLRVQDVHHLASRNRWCQERCTRDNDATRSIGMVDERVFTPHSLSAVEREHTCMTLVHTNSTNDVIYSD